MTRYAPQLQLGLILATLLLAFWLSADFQHIAAGVAIFLLGMVMLEDGFKALGGSVLERILARATGTLPRAMGFGVLATAVTQSSSLVSVISISFLSAGLITLQAGMGIIFGANLGTTTGAWLIAGVGLKVDIARYAMPMLAIGAVLMFQRAPAIRGAGQVVLGIGLIFLGIAFIKDGFDAFSARFDLSQLALAGLVGLAVYTLLGAAATVVMQSSHATMLLVITALASGQIGYENALAVAIGANIGTTVTALIGAASANYQGKRLALGHLIFNFATAIAALVLIVPLRHAVDLISDLLGIRPDDFALRLAVFHTLFNLLGLAIMVPLMARLVRFLERRIAAPAPNISKPRYINADLGAFPAPILAALGNELRHLHENAARLICEGLNLRLDDLTQSKDIGVTVARSNDPILLDFERRYEDKVKSLHAAIVEFSAQKATLELPATTVTRLQELRDAAGAVVRAVKAIKHMRRNTQRFTTVPHGEITQLYDNLRCEIAQILVEIERLEGMAPEARSSLWIEEERAALDHEARAAVRQVEGALQTRRISAADATSFLNDSGYAFEAMRALLDAAQLIYRPPDMAEAEIERLLELDDDELTQKSAQDVS
ncbi:phosphate:Na+ symporter [Roseinatronobacter thiooxidans]|uniref:Phosphate:Na+ symporter n=1 Tax=Roseinatronobacter thiooxidans TaxID=121821 RepID=A0A2W7QA15_9RHOB|nr:Na/Pi symporter [Roseinatronobacter thiooxidans]PZX45518.1 phosphate:Na+ symporter [Roseinatronobacter thiooxidans]